MIDYFSMFSGIGGFEYGIEQAASDYRGRIQKQTSEDLSGSCSDSTPKENGTLCVGYSEINKYASAIYRYHYPNHKNYGNAKELVPESLPDFDLLVGGFPCQAFSVAGKRQGFKDTRGTLFFDVARVLKAKRPEWLLLENVKGLCSHEGGETLATIYGVLTDLGYTVGWEVVNSVQFGVPQNRERIFIVGHLTAAGGRAGEILPVRKTAKIHNAESGQNNVANCLDKSYHKGWLDHGQRTHVLLRWQNKDAGAVKSEFASSLRASGGTDIRKKDHLIENDSIRRLTPLECERLQGFPDNWTRYGIMDGGKVEISDTQRYKALGNAVTTNVVEAFASNLFEQAEKR